MRYFVELAYNGKDYHGWQNQPNAISVQEVLEKAFSTLLTDEISITGAGRTDTGVHATQMYAHFDTDIPFEEENLVFRMNAFLPKDIVIHSIFKVNPEAHARFDAISRSYLYRISPEKNPFSIDNAYFFRPKLDLKAMNKACEVLLEYHDFQCFSKSNTDVKTYNCDIKSAQWKLVDSEVHFTIIADRFLRNMVRAIVGTMIEIGVGKISIAELYDIIDSKDRSKAGYSVPAHGLYLTSIEYPKTIGGNE